MLFVHNAFYFISNLVLSIYKSNTKPNQTNKPKNLNNLMCYFEEALVFVLFIVVALILTLQCGL